MKRCEDGWCLPFRDRADCGPQHVNAWCGEMPEDEMTLTRRAYTALVNFIDEQVERLYNELVERRFLERTWVVWFSDHGDCLGDHYLWRKSYPYECSVRMPLLLRWPETWAASQPPGLLIARGSVLRPPIVAEIRDIFHTLVVQQVLHTPGRSWAFLRRTVSPSCACCVMRRA